MERLGNVSTIHLIIKTAVILLFLLDDRAVILLQNSQMTLITNGIMWIFETMVYWMKCELITCSISKTFIADTFQSSHIRDALI